MQTYRHTKKVNKHFKVTNGIEYEFTVHSNKICVCLHFVTQSVTNIFSQNVGLIIIIINNERNIFVN